MIERAAKIAREHEGDDAAKQAPEAATKVTPIAKKSAPARNRASQPGIEIGEAVIQAKLSVGPAGDAYEREADAVAARVVRTLRSDTTPAPDDRRAAEPRVQRSEPDVGGDGSSDEGDGESVDVGGRLRRIQRAAFKPAVVAGSITRIQRAASIGASGGDLDDDTARMLKSSRSGGRPLPDPARTKMETAFGADFSGVRVHAGPTSTELNDRIQAKAFTTGSDIYFRDSVPDVSSSSGQELLAHELTHTIQQGAAVHRTVDTIQRWKWPWTKEPPPPPTVSAPFNVHKRAGEGEIEQVDATKRPDPDETLDKDAELLSTGAREEASNSSPGAEIPDTEELGENDILFPSPSVDDIALPTKAVIDDDPVGVISAYTHYAGQFLKLSQRHDVKIERYARFFEADYAVLSVAKSQYETAEQTKDEATKKKLEKDMGGKPADELSEAEIRLQNAHDAEAATDKEVPLVDGVYEQARDQEKKFKATTGGRSISYTEARLDRIMSAAEDATFEKHEKRLVELHAAREEGGRLGTLVKQAKLSEGHLKIKRGVLKAHKTKVKGSAAKGRAVATDTHLKNKGRTALLGAGTSLLTLGIVNFGQDKDDGGYSSSRRFTPIWVRVKDEFRRIQEMTDKRPYGPVTTVHAVLEVLSYLIKEIRNILASVTVLATLAALLGAPVAAAIAGVAGTLAVGFAALKLVIDAILASWSVIERIRNTNARNSDLLTAQATRQGADVVGDALSLAGSYGGAAAGNAAGGKDMFSGGHERLGNDGWRSTSASGAPIVGHVANTATQVGGTLAGEAASSAATTESLAGSSSQQSMKMNHMRQDRFGERSAVNARGAMPAGAGRATRPVEKPAWLQQAEADEAKARTESLNTLISVHAAKIKRFHAKTQALMSSSSDLAKNAPNLKKQAPAEEPEQQEDQGNFIDMARSFPQILAGVGAVSGEVDADALRAQVAV